MTVQDDPYVRVYYRALTDEKFQPLSSAAWGHWVRMLVVADGMFPSSAPLPRWVERKALQELVRAGIVDLDGTDYFRIHGMEPERDKRADAARFAADVKHHGLPEAERRRAERAAGAVQSDAPAALSAAAQPAGGAIDASPLLSAPLRSEPLHSTPSREPNLMDRPTDDETALCLLAEQLSGTPYGLQLHSAMGQKAKAMLAKHGPAAVEAEWRRIAAEERGMPTVRQLVLGADNALNRVSAPTSPVDRRDEVADFVARMNREAEEARKGMPRVS